MTLGPTTDTSAWGKPALMLTYKQPGSVSKRAALSSRFSIG